MISSVQGGEGDRNLEWGVKLRSGNNQKYRKDVKIPWSRCSEEGLKLRVGCEIRGW